MKKYGRINFLGDLEYASNTIQNDGCIIVNPTDEEYLANGYKLVMSDEPLADREGYNIEKYYQEDEWCIYIKYRYVEIVDPESGGESESVIEGVPILVEFD